MLGNWESLKYFAPESVLVACSLALFVADLVLRRSARRVAWLTGLTGLSVALVAAALWMLPAQPAALFGGLLAHDPTALFFKWVTLGAVALTVAIVPPSRELSSARLGEFYALLLTLTLGMFMMAGATDLLTIYLSIELVSLVSYVLTGFKRGDRRANEGALKYVIYGGVASGIMLFGMSYLYGLFGTTGILGDAGIAAQVADVSKRLFVERAFGSAKAAELAMVVSVVFIMAGIGYKIAAVPWHMWAPDVYEAAPTPFTTFLSVGPKAAGFAVAIRVFYSAFAQPAIPGMDDLFVIGADVPWPAILGVIAAATMTLGNLAAIVQTNMKRLLAYSSIAHAGYVVMGLTTVTGDGARAAMFYLVVYLLMNVGAFLAVIAVARATGSESIHDYRGLGRRAPVLAAMMTIFLLSLTGLPPFAGFAGKFLLFSAVIAKGGFWYWILALIGVVYSAISLYYYARIIKAMYLEQPFSEEPVAVGGYYGTLLVALAASVLYFGLFWAPIQEWTRASFKLIGPGT